MKKHRSSDETQSSESTVYGSCSYCHQSLEKGACQHWVASLSDDSDGHDTQTPLYFAWTNHCGEVQEAMIASIDNYFEALCTVCERVAREGTNEAQRVLFAAKEFPSSERVILHDAIELLDQPNAFEHYETV